MSARVREKVVTVGGQRRTLRLDFNALCTAEETTGKSYLGGTTGQFRDIRALLYGSLLSGAKKHKEPTTFAIDDVGDWMGEDVEGDKTLGTLFLELWADFNGTAEAGEDGEAADPQTVEMKESA